MEGERRRVCFTHSIATTFYLVFAILFSVAGISNCYKVLVVSSPVGGSHTFHMIRVAEIFSAKGHDTTLLRNDCNVESMKQVTKKSGLKMKVYNSPGATAAYEASLKGEGSDNLGWNVTMGPAMLKVLYNIQHEDIKTVLGNKALATELKQEKFDIFIIDEFVSYGLTAWLIKELNIPHISYATGTLLQESAYVMGIPSPISYIQVVPSPFREMRQEPTFTLRLANLGNFLFARFAFGYYCFEYAAEGLIRESFGPDAPSLVDYVSNASMVFLHSDLAFEVAKPLLPNVVSFGGILCKPAKPLENELEKWMQSSGTAGVVYASFGTNVGVDFMGPDVIQVFLTAFGRLPYKVLWKLDSDLKDYKVPSNIKLSKWLPQQDILGHSKTRAFLTHGGLNSVYETIYHAVPVVGVAVFGDQPGNVASLVRLGIGEDLDKNNLHADDLVRKITTVVKDPRYKESVKRQAAILRDHPMTAADRANYWLEYVVRHKGARHLKPQGLRHLNFIQYFMLDVIAFLIAIVVAALSLCCCCIKRCCCGRSTSETKEVDASHKKVKRN